MLSIQWSLIDDCQSITRIITLAVLFVTQNALLLQSFLSVMFDPRQLLIEGILFGDPVAPESGFGSPGEAKDHIVCVCVCQWLCRIEEMKAQTSLKTFFNCLSASLLHVLCQCIVSESMF